jgi:hypothetical protein
MPHQCECCQGFQSVQYVVNPFALAVDDKIVWQYLCDQCLEDLSDNI